jgi:predicted anti-sigma-YlaC factor YlaD
MTSCEEYAPYLAAAADGEWDAVPSSLLAEVRAHLKSCSTCAGEVDRLAAVKRVYTSEGPPSVEAARWEQVWANIEQQTRPEAIPHPVLRAKNAWRGWAAISAVAVAAAILLAVWVLPFGERQAEPIAAGPAAEAPVALATAADTNIEQMEAFDDDGMPMVITAGQDGVLVVWVAGAQTEKG